MAKEDALDIIMILRMFVSVGFVFIMILLFVFLKVEVVNDDMQRFDMEIANTLASYGPMTSQRSVFVAEKLFAFDGNLPRACEYEYSVVIESTGARKTCEKNEDCINFCKEVLGKEDIGSDYDCNFELFGQDFCECGGRDGHYWKFGKDPVDAYRTWHEEFPAVLKTKSGNVPASVAITAHDSFLTRISCIAQKAYETKSNVSMSIDVNELPLRQGGGDTHFGRRDTDVCVYTEGSSVSNCRASDVPVDDFNVNEAFGIIVATSHGDITSGTKTTITAYPLKADTNCLILDSVAGFGDNVQKIILCAK